MHALPCLPSHPALSMQHQWLWPLCDGHQLMAPVTAEAGRLTGPTAGGHKPAGEVGGMAENQCLRSEVRLI